MSCVDLIDNMACYDIECPKTLNFDEMRLEEDETSHLESPINSFDFQHRLSEI
jgi:hypothetical protein